MKVFLFSSWESYLSPGCVYYEVSLICSLLHDLIRSTHLNSYINLSQTQLLSIFQAFYSITLIIIVFVNMFNFSALPQLTSQWKNAVLENMILQRLNVNVGLKEHC